jgi:uncharacterized surface protein with fasciclin (FAS1) repeats
MKYFISTLCVVVITVLLMAGCHKKSGRPQKQVGKLKNPVTAESSQTKEGTGPLNARLGPYKNGSIPTILSSKPELSTFLFALKKAGMIQELSSNGHKVSNKSLYTVFAPNNEAFEKLPDDTLNKLMKPANKKKLAKLLRYHLVKGKINASILKTKVVEHNHKGQIVNVEGGKLHLTLQHAYLRINGAKIISKNIKATNGLIYIINKVLLPPKMQ